MNILIVLLKKKILRNTFILSQKIKISHAVPTRRQWVKLKKILFVTQKTPIYRVLFSKWLRIFTNESFSTWKSLKVSRENPLKIIIMVLVGVTLRKWKNNYFAWGDFEVLGGSASPNFHFKLKVLIRSR